LAGRPSRSECQLKLRKEKRGSVTRRSAPTLLAKK
jgi:hypothetical protein